MTNDPANPQAKLHISGKVEKFVTFSPRVVRLTGQKGKSIKSTVKIIPEKKYPFSIVELKAKDGKNINYSFEELKGEEKGYLLHVENTLEHAGSYHDSIILKTDSKVKPEIPVRVYARITDPDAKKPIPVQGKKNKNANTSANPFLELIQKMQDQKALEKGEKPGAAPSQNPAQAEELKKKFEELIKQAQKKKQAQKQENKE